MYLQHEQLQLDLSAHTFFQNHTGSTLSTPQSENATETSGTSISGCMPKYIWCSCKQVIQTYLTNCCCIIAVIITENVKT